MVTNTKPTECLLNEGWPSPLERSRNFFSSCCRLLCCWLGPLGKHSPSLFASAHTSQLISFRPTDLLIRARELLHPVVVVFWAETFRAAGQSVRGCMLGSHLAGAHRKEDRRGRPSVGIKLSSGLLLNKPFGREQS